MTREQWKAMTMGQRRIKVAELAGWEHAKYPTDGRQDVVYWWNLELDKSRPPSDDGIRTEIPDYLNDLNAMHEAEKLLDYNDLDQIGDYIAHLTYAMSAFNVSWMLTFDKANWMWTFATAAQRAEAFVLTLDKGDL